jgi:hypothetical protein
MTDVPGPASAGPFISPLRSSRLRLNLLLWRLHGQHRRLLAMYRAHLGAQPTQLSLELPR